MSETAAQTHSATTSRLAPGDVIDDRYEVIEFLGEGGFATVYKARHVHIHREVAIKILDTTKVPKTSEFEERFVREAQTAAQIDHPNVVTIHDFGFTGAERQPYIAMELLNGHDLEEELQQNGRLDPAKIIPLYVACLEALGEAHKAGIVHKDLKPSNLFISHPDSDREMLQILDFGVASINQAGSKRLTSTGQILGTPQYLAPEYIQSQISSPALDVYQMGLILIETLTGVPVIDADNPFTCLMVHCQGSYKIPAALLEPPLGPILTKSLLIEHTERFQDANEFREALRAVDASLIPPLTEEDFESRVQVDQVSKYTLSELKVLAEKSAEAARDGGQISMADTMASVSNPVIETGSSTLDSIELGVGSQVNKGLIAAVLIACVILGVVLVLIFTGGGKGEAPAEAGTDPETGAGAATDEAAEAAAAAGGEEAGIDTPTDETEPAGDTAPPTEATDETAEAEAEAIPEVPTDEGTDTVEDTPPAEEVEPKVEQVQLFLASDPSGATVFNGADKLGVTPNVAMVTKGEDEIVLRFVKDGYELAEIPVTPAENQTVSPTLKKKRRVRTGKSSKTSKGSGDGGTNDSGGDQTDKTGKTGKTGKTMKIAP